MHRDGQVRRRRDALGYQRCPDIVPHLRRLEERFENGFALRIVSPQFHTDQIERKHPVAALPHGGPRADLIEGIAIEFDGLARTRPSARAAEDAAKPLIQRLFDFAQEAHGIKCNCWAAATMSPAIGAAAVPP